MARDPMNGLPGMGTERTSEQRSVLASEQGAVFLPRGVIIDGSEARDPGNSFGIDILRAGTLLGKITSTGLFAPSIIGGLAAAYDASADTTEMTVSAAVAVEMVRRIGASGTFKITGPPAASGTVQTATVTYSAINVTTGVITITALAVSALVNEVQTITPTVEANADCVQTITTAGTQTAGTFKLGIRSLGRPDGAIRWTDTIAWSATEATQTASVQTALDNLLGANVIVATEIADTATMVLVLTFSGTGATNTVHGLVAVDISALTGASTAVVAMTTEGAGVISAGEYRLGIVDDDGDLQITDPIEFDADATAINVALDAALGATLVVATGGPMSGPTAVALTFSGVGYTGLGQSPVEVDINDLVGCGSVSVVETTAGAAAVATANDYLIGSLIRPTDGSEQPRGIISDGPGHQVTAQDRATSVDIGLPLLCVGGIIKTAQIILYPSDTSLEAWLKAQLRLTGYGYLFDDDFAA